MSKGKIYKLDGIDSFVHVVDTETSKAIEVPMSDVTSMVAMFLNTLPKTDSLYRFYMLRNMVADEELQPLSEKASEEMDKEYVKICEGDYITYGTETISYINVCVWSNAEDDDVISGRLGAYIKSQISEGSLANNECLSIPVCVLKDCLVLSLRKNNTTNAVLDRFLWSLFNLLKHHYSDMETELG